MAINQTLSSALCVGLQDDMHSIHETLPHSRIMHKDVGLLCRPIALLSILTALRKKGLSSTHDAARIVGLCKNLPVTDTDILKFYQWQGVVLGF